MQLNEHPNHDEATVSMKVVLLAFAVVLVGALGYLVYQQNHSTTDTGAVANVNLPNPSDTTTESDTSTPNDETADWKTYTGNYFTFKYPGNLSVKIGTSTPANPEIVELIDGSNYYPISVETVSLDDYITNARSQIDGFTQSSVALTAGSATKLSGKWNSTTRQDQIGGSVTIFLISGSQKLYQLMQSVNKDSSSIDNETFLLIANSFTIK